MAQRPCTYPPHSLLIDACQSQEVTWPRVRGLFVFAAARGDLRLEPGPGHCFRGLTALLVSAVLGSRPFPACSGVSDGGECGESVWGGLPRNLLKFQLQLETLLEGMGA